MTRRKKTAQITVRIDPNLKEVAERAAAKDRRSLTSLIERLLVKHLRNRGLFSVPQRQPKEAARTALKLALREIDAIGDGSLPAQERETRKRRLLHGPEEFCNFRSDQPKLVRRSNRHVSVNRKAQL
jgi:hypothetical protein